MLNLDAPKNLPRPHDLWLTGVSIMALTDAAVKNAKSKDKTYRLADSGGLYLEVSISNGRYWRLKYRFGGKEKRLAIGVYPGVSLKDARSRRDEARKQLSQGIDPGEHKKTLKLAQVADTNTFEVVAREWHEKFSPNWTTKHSKDLLTRLVNDVFPWIGKRPIKDITAPDLLMVLRRMEARGILHTTHRIKQYCGQVFRYGIATGRCERDPSGDLHGAIPPAKEKHHASITEPTKIGELLRALEDYQGSFITQCALKLAPLVFVRPGELRHAEWHEINFDAAEWRIPAHKMKKRAIHVVPLSTQALAIVEELKPITGNGCYIFPSIRTNTRPMSENTVLGALRRLGYDKNEMTGHGFRSMASTLLNEQGWHRDAIERQLAHAERDGVRSAYNYAEYLPERRKMMQSWADYLDSLKNGTQ